MHFLVERRTEVCAVKRIDTWSLRLPKQCFCLTGHYKEFGVSRTLYGKAMRSIEILLKIGQVNVDLVTYLDSFNIVRLLMDVM